MPTGVCASSLGSGLSWLSQGTTPFTISTNRSVATLSAMINVTTVGRLVRLFM